MPDTGSPTSPPLFTVILAGGSGTRFWPASRRTLPKQLLGIGPGAPKSLLRSTAERLWPLSGVERTLVLTGRHLLRQSRDELPELEGAAFLAEPIAKNTAPCIAWASARVAALDPNAILLVVPSDQHVEDEAAFRAILGRAVEHAQQGHIVTVGIVPTRPETGYGYIEVGSDLGEGAFEVARFVEKPNQETAERYVSGGGFLWNAGMFVFRAGTMLEALDRHAPALASAARDLAERSEGTSDAASEGVRDPVLEFFEAAQAISIDYAVMEKESGLRVVSGDFGWSDLGSWESAWELGVKDAAGNVGRREDVFVDASRNLVFVGDGCASGKTVALVGLDDVCVLDTGDALLVVRRERSQDVRLVVEELKRRGKMEKL